MDLIEFHPINCRRYFIHWFANFIDAGVPDKCDINFTGAQYDYNPAHHLFLMMRPDMVQAMLIMKLK